MAIMVMVIMVMLIMVSLIDMANKPRSKVKCSSSMLAVGGRGAWKGSQGDPATHQARHTRRPAAAEGCTW